MYYVYALVDPISNQPFYIGKGKKSNNRHKDHLTERRGKENMLRWHKICKLRKQNLEPVIEILIDNIEDEAEAYSKESGLIKQYGKIIDNTGILTNIIDDGQPPSQKGKTKSAEHRKKLSEAHKGKTLSKETVNKILETKIKNGTLKSGMKGKTHSLDTKEKISKSKQGSKMSVDSSLKKSVQLKGKPWSEARKLAALTQRKSGPKSK